MGFCLWFLLAGPTPAHINSPHFYLEQDAGPYPVIVVIHMPPAIPGEADVQTRIQQSGAADDVSVWVRAIPPDGVEHAPDWVRASRSPVDRDFYTTPMALMTFGTWRVQVRVEGTLGEGIVVAPVNASRPNPRKMSSFFKGLLLTLVSLLLVSAWQVGVVLRRDATRDEESRPTPRDVRTGRLAGAVVLGVVVTWFGFIGYSWWAADRAFRSRGAPVLKSALQIANPPAVAGKQLQLQLTVTDRRDRLVQAFASDRGKQIHLIVVDAPAAATLLHAHPALTGPGRFSFSFTPPAAGNYDLFADVAREYGVTETVVSSLEVAPGSPGAEPSMHDPDDSLSLHPAIDEAVIGAVTSDVGDGLRMRWVEPDPITLRQGEFYRLVFELETRDGDPVETLDSYEGGLGHMIVLRHDSGVFTRLYPTGTPGGSASTEPGDALPRPTSSSFDTARAAFPYGFPQQGRYRCWVQLRHDGHVRTGVFDVGVR